MHDWFNDNHNLKIILTVPAMLLLYKFKFANVDKLPNVEGSVPVCLKRVYK